MGGTYMMLSGLCVECLAKGLILSRDPTLVETGKIPGSIRSHDLAKLVAHAGMTDLDGKTDDLLRRLTQAVRWHGRYPVSTDYEHKSGRIGMNIPEDYRLIEELQRQLINLAESQLPADAFDLLKATWQLEDLPSS
jgi:hypothetical protein